MITTNLNNTHLGAKVRLDDNTETIIRGYNNQTQVAIVVVNSIWTKKKYSEITLV